ncbi:hypothetical protein D3C72_1833760 [compost metagenome]
MGVEHLDLHVRQRPADVRRGAGVDARPCGVDSSFGGAVDIDGDPATAPHGGGDVVPQRTIDGFSTDQHVRQRVRPLRRFLQYEFEQARRAVDQFDGV